MALCFRQVVVRLADSWPGIFFKCINSNISYANCQSNVDINEQVELKLILGICSINDADSRVGAKGSDQAKPSLYLKFWELLDSVGQLGSVKCGLSGDAVRLLFFWCTLNDWLWGILRKALSTGTTTP